MAATKVDIALDILKKQLNQPLAAALEVCARCGICAESCHYYASEPRIEHTPVARAENLRRVYRLRMISSAESSHPGQGLKTHRSETG
jgi:ferredoxin